MIRTILVYGGSMALGAFALRWLEYRHAIRMFPTELYVVLVALLMNRIILVYGVISGVIIIGSAMPNRCTGWA